MFETTIALLRMYVRLAEESGMTAAGICAELRSIPGLEDGLEDVMEKAGLQYIIMSEEELDTMVERCVLGYLKDYETADDEENKFSLLLSYNLPAHAPFTKDELELIFCAHDSYAVLDTVIRRRAKDIIEYHYQTTHKGVLSRLCEGLGVSVVPAWIAAKADKCIREHLDIKIPMNTILDSTRLNMNIFLKRNGNGFASEMNNSLFWWVDARIDKSTLLLLLSSQGKTVEEFKDGFKHPSYWMGDKFLKSLRSTLLAAPDSTPTFTFLVDMSLREALVAKVSIDTVKAAEERWLELVCQADATQIAHLANTHPNKSYMKLAEGTTCGIYCRYTNRGSFDMQLEKPIQVPLCEIGLFAPDGTCNYRAISDTLELPSGYWRYTYDYCLVRGEDVS